MKGLLEGAAVFITGGASGIGRGVAEAVAEAGAAVGVGDVDAIGAADTTRKVEASGGRAFAVSLDVTRSSDIDAAIEQMRKRFGRLDGWVNAAGVIRLGAAIEASREDWDVQFGVNARALMEACQAAARQMASQPLGGAIVNVASNAGKVGYRNMAAYNASKAAVISLTRSLSMEWADRGININAVCPGGVDTPMLAGVAEWLAPRLGMESAALLTQMKPQQMDRHVRPLEVGRVVAFLLSDHATIIRGQSINVDGGDTPY